MDIELPPWLVDALPASGRQLVLDLRSRLFPDTGIPSPLEALTPSRIPFDLSAIGALIGRSLPVINTGIRLDDEVHGEQRITIRIELDDFNQNAYETSLERYRRGGVEDIVTFNLELLRTHSAERRAMWEAFYANPSTDRLQGPKSTRRQWAVVVSSNFLTDVVRERIEQTVTSTSPSFGSRPGFTPSVRWSAIDGQARLLIHMEGTLRDICTCGWSTSDINAGVDLTFTFGMAHPDVLGLDVHLDWHTDALVTTCCIVTATLVWPAIGIRDVIDRRINVWTCVGGMAIGPFALLIAGIAAAASASPGDLSALAVGDITLSRRDDHNLHGETVLTGRFRFDRFPALAATAVEGHSDALVIAGEFGEIRSEPVAVLHCDETLPFAWTVRDACQSAFVADVSNIVLSNTGGRRLHLETVTISGDPIYEGALRWRLDQVPPTFIWPMGRRNLTVLVSPNRFPEAVPAAFPPARVLIRTDRGARLLTIDGLAPISEQLAREMILLAEGPCGHRRNTFFEQGPGKARFRLADPLGEPDPKTDSPLLLVISGHGFAERERIAIVGRGGRELSAAITTIEGALRLSTLFEVGGLDGAEIVRTGFAHGKPLKAAPYHGDYKRPAAITKQEMIIRGFLLTRRSEVKGVGKLIDHRLAHWNGREVLLATGTEGVLAVRVDSAGFGKHVAEVEAKGLRGTVALGRNLYAFGDWGFATITSDGQLKLRYEQPVSDVTVRDNKLLLLTSAGIVSWNGSQFETISEAFQSKAEFNGLAMIGHVLVAYGLGGLLRLGSQEMDRAKLDLPVERVSPLLTDLGRVLVRIDGRDAIIDLLDQQALRVVVELDVNAEDNWQARTVGSPGVLAVARNDGFTIDLLSTDAVVQAEPTT